MVEEALSQLGAPRLLFNQRRFATTQIEFALASGGLTGLLETDGQGCRLEDVRGVYVRLMDARLLPEVTAEPPDSPARSYADAVHEALTRWCDVTPARVVNRTAAMCSNASKPYQAQLIRAYGFHVPETLVTSDPDLVHEFRRRHGRVVYKSMSGVRSVVKTLDAPDVERLNRIRWCPAQFQEYVEGTDVRVHVVDDEVFATAVRSDATDYRYAQSQVGRPAELEAMTLPDDVAERCVRLSQGLGLTFSGIDLRLVPDGRVVCFEVNPCPGFSYFEAHTGQPIARAVAQWLAGG
jgi:glutathione synthase/RimK-type ligase-like ATP-grasp enzyme